MNHDESAEITDLLRDAAVTGPVPDDVAADLEATLGRLVAERAAAAEGAADGVVQLRRRPARSGRILVAAAAVVLLGAGGIGLTEVLGSTQQSDSAATTADSLAGTEGFEVPQAPTLTGSDDRADGAGGAGGLSAYDTAGSLNRLASINFTAADFGTQVTGFVTAATRDAANNPGYSTQDQGSLADPGSPATPERGSAPTPLPGAQAGDPGAAGRDVPGKPGTELLLGDLAAAQSTKAACRGPEVSREELLLQITFEGRRAVLVVGPVRDLARSVTAWSCNGTAVLATASIPA